MKVRHRWKRPFLSVLIALLVWSCLPASVLAENDWLLFDGCHWNIPRLKDQWQQRSCWDRDDYCRKSLPCVAGTPRGCLDDYCSKPLPCVRGTPPGCLDDYCRKRLPLFIAPWWKAANSCECGQGADASCVHCRSD